MSSTAYADDCLLDTNNDGDVDLTDTDGGANSGGNDFRLACGNNAVATGNSATAVGATAEATQQDSTGIGRFARGHGVRAVALGSTALASQNDATALGTSTIASGINSTAVGSNAVAAFTGATSVGVIANADGLNATALGFNADAGGIAASALGDSAEAAGERATALGVSSSASGSRTIALGYDSSASSTTAIAMGSDSLDADFLGAQATAPNSIAIGTDTNAGFNSAIVIGAGASATEAGQIVLGSTDTFTILGNGNVGMGTATPGGNLDVDSGTDDTFLLLTNTAAQWAIKVNAGNGRMTIGNNTTGAKPFKFGPNGVGNLLQVGIVANNQVDIKGNLVTTGTVTTGGPTCGGGCDAVFDADYDLPSIEEHAAQMYAKKHLPEVGPTIPHAPINISEQYGRMLNELEKAHIYIAQMNAEKQGLETKLAQQISTNQNQDARLARLEALLTP